MLKEQQASNEELKSTNEELQSTNEELVTVNAELQLKIEQMAGMQDDMKNLLDNIRIGTIFLDRRMLIRRFTRGASKVYRLAGTDIGRPLADIRSELQGGDLLADAQTVLESLVPIERELSTAGGTWYLVRIQPYCTVDNLIDGVVMTFADVTERVQAIATRKARDIAEAIVDAVSNPLVVLDGRLQVLSANRAFHREFGGSAPAVPGQSFFEIGGGQWDFSALHELLDKVLPNERGFEGRAVEHDFPGLGPRRLKLSARRVAEPAATGDLVLLSIEVVGAAPA